jgi:hypothetical protein
MFKYDTIYSGRYTCTTNPHVFDQLPLFVVLEIRGQTMLACNIHWIAGALRPKFMQVLCEMRKKCINESMFRLFYRMVKYNPQLNFALCSVRKYYMRNMTNVREVPSEQWQMITNLTASLYRARYMVKSGFHADLHVVQRGARQYPNQPPRPPQKKPQVQQQVQQGQQNTNQPQGQQQQNQQPQAPLQAPQQSRLFGN